VWTGWAVWLYATRHRPWAWWGLGCFAGLYVLSMSQWEAWLSGAALLPWLGAVLACKPHVGAALWLAYPSRTALVSGLALVALSLLLLPSWPYGWLHAVQSSPFHFRAPVQYGVGPLVLLALAEWRRPEARLLVALACVPQTVQMYSVFPLFLIPRTHAQGAVLCAGVWAVLFGFAPHDPTGHFEFHRAADVAGPLFSAFVYLPCTWMVLKTGTTLDPIRRRYPTLAPWLA
jgi:hypothetical protein